MAEISLKADIDPFEICILAGLYQDKPLVNVGKQYLFSEII